MSNLTKLAAALGIALTLSACAPSPETPVADTLIDPTEQNDYHTMTLLESAVQQGVPEKVATVAFQKYDDHTKKVKNSRFITMIDFTQDSGSQRMYVIDRKSGAVDSILVAHGEGSDTRDAGIPNKFSNVPNSRMSSLGSYIVAERYVGKYGPSMKLDGIESMNSNVRKRTIVMHPAPYIKEGRSKQGMSWGCPAVPFEWIDRLISRLRDGSFMYIVGDNTYSESQSDLNMLQMALDPNFKWTDESY